MIVDLLKRRSTWHLHMNSTPLTAREAAPGVLNAAQVMQQIGNQLVAFLDFKLAGTSQRLPIVALGGMKLAEILANHSQLVPHRGELCVGPCTP